MITLILKAIYSDWVEPKEPFTGDEIASIVFGAIAAVAIIVAIIYAIRYICNQCVSRQ